MRVISKFRFKLGLSCLNKLFFKDAKTFVNKKVNYSFSKSLLFGVVMLLFLSSCEDKSINKEIVRLQTLEKELIKTISEKNTERAKLICIQMKWEYVATTVGAGAKCKNLSEIWDDKRRNYLKIMGMNPDEILGEKPKPKSLKEKLIESY